MKDKTRQYQIHTNKRPLKIAYLLNPKSKYFKKHYDAIVDYSTRKWGGRYNPIILTNGKTLSKEWLTFLKTYDPDYIRTSFDISSNLLKILDRELSAFYIDKMRIDKDGSVSVRSLVEGLSIFPSQKNINTVATPFFFDNPKIALFETESKPNSLLTKFLSRNFGLYSSGVINERSLQGVEKSIFKIKNIKDLNGVLSGLGEYHVKSPVYPIQISSIPNYLPDVKESYKYENFTIIIGDSPEDLTYLWNSLIFTPKWRRHSINRLWIPSSFIKNKAILVGLQKWLRRWASKDGGRGDYIDFISYSHGQTELKSYAQTLLEGTYLYPSFPDYNNKSSLCSFDIQNTAFRRNDNQVFDVQKASGNKDFISFEDPEYGYDGERWVADMYIEFRPERYDSYTNTKYYWQLPKQNGLALGLFNNHPSRINAERFPSVIMSKGESLLNINLLDDRRIFYSSITNADIHYIYTDDLRRSIPRKLSFNRLELSDKGQYLFGFLDVFRGLENANNYLEKEYWRQIFDLYANNSRTSKARQVKELENRISKTMKSIKSPNSDWVVKQIINFSNKITNTTRELCFSDFEEKWKEGIEEHNKNNPKNIFEYHNEDLLNSIDNLLNLKILFAGFKPKCPFCGSRNWYGINEAKGFCKCKGCFQQFSLGAEEKWYYKLNSLVHAGHNSHGLTPVVLVLYELLRDARTSFIYYPSIDILGSKKKPLGDLDIVCIQDGKFIIGEVKQSADLFNIGVLKKMEKLAISIKPDGLLFSAMYGEPNQTIKDEIQEIQKRMAKHNIKVGWLHLSPWTMQPSPFI